MTSYLLQRRIAALWEATPLDRLDILILVMFLLQIWQAGIKAENGDIISLADCCLCLLKL